MQTLLAQVVALAAVRSRTVLSLRMQSRQAVLTGIPETTSGCSRSDLVINEVQTRARRLAESLPPLHP